MAYNSGAASATPPAALSGQCSKAPGFAGGYLQWKSRNPRNAHLQKLALALECQVSDLTGELDSADGSELEREVLAGLRSTDKQGQEMIRRFVRSLNRDDPPSAPSPRANGPEQPRPVSPVLTCRRRWPLSGLSERARDG